MKCPNCNSIIPDDCKFCNHCGQRIEHNSGVIRCSNPKCREEIPSNSKFCPICGMRLSFNVQNQESVLIICTEGDNCSICGECGGDNSVRLKKGNNVISEMFFPWIKNGFFFGNGDGENWNEEIKSVDLSRFDSSYITNMCLMFDGCSSIETIDFNGFNTSNVDDMNCLFGGCSSLKRLDLSGFDTSKVIDMGQMFEGCLSLEYLNLGGYNTNNTENMDYMFEDCNSLKQVVLKNCDPKTIRMITGAIAEACIAPEIITN